MIAYVLIEPIRNSRTGENPFLFTRSDTIPEGWERRYVAVEAFECSGPVGDMGENARHVGRLHRDYPEDGWLRYEYGLTPAWTFNALWSALRLGQAPWTGRRI